MVCIMGKPLLLILLLGSVGISHCQLGFGGRLDRLGRLGASLQVPTGFGIPTGSGQISAGGRIGGGQLTAGGQLSAGDLSANAGLTGAGQLNFQANINPIRPTASVGFVGRISPEDLINEEWSAFKLTYNKTYPTQEIENFRREIFIENRAKIARFNQEYGEGKRSFVQQLNIYGDMLFHEFNRLLNGFNRTDPNGRQIPQPTGSTFIPSANVILPENMDWRQVGAVSSVKSQGTCAGCWAFAAAGALEAQNFRRYGTLTELSPQNLIDCTKPQGNNGCNGGNTNPAFEYVRDNPGIDTEASYPYEGQDGPCRFREDSIGGVCSGFVDIAEGDERGLEIAVATIGPVTAAMDAGRETFQFYSDGIYFDQECKNEIESMNHAVLVVGFGVEPDGQKYWLIKNSYGPQWGIGGYLKLAKDRDNHCGISTVASYPLV